jgi:hypothetical protein
MAGRSEAEIRDQLRLTLDRQIGMVDSKLLVEAILLLDKKIVKLQEDLDRLDNRVRLGQ